MGAEQTSGRDDGVTVPLLRVHLLGGFRVSRDGGSELPERWPRPSARALVKLLAVVPDHRLHREQALEICWPDSDPQAAQGSLRVALHAARHALEPELAPRAASSYLVSEGPMLALDPALVWVDADDAERRARAALADGGEPEILDALDRFTGELLPEDRYEEWTEVRRGTLNRLHLDLQLALAGLRQQRGAVADSMDLAEQVLVVSPAEESAHRLLIQGYLDQGLGRSAMRQYHRCRHALEAELGIRPDADTERLHRAALAARPAPAPARPSLPAPLRGAPTPLYGRDATLSELLRGSGPPVVLLTGDPGVGKTRLAAEVARRACDEGAAVLWASGHEAETQTPYAMFADALDGWLAECSATERAQVGAEYPKLAALLPSLGMVEIARFHAPEQERDRLFRATSLLLSGLAAGQQVLVVLDDMHGGDAGSFQLLAHLARQAVAADLAIRFLLTYREEELAEGDLRRSSLSALGRQGIATAVEVSPLEKDACLALVRDLGLVDAGAPDRVWDLSLGNPLFALELARGLALGDQAPTPTSLRALVTERIERLDADARRVLEILAVGGGEAALVELTDVAAHGLHPAVSGAAAVSALERALSSSIAEERTVLIAGRAEPGLAFRHPLVRLVCYEQLSGIRRRGLHAAFAETVLARRPDSVDTLASHFTRADDPRAAEYLRRAAERAAALYANDTADRYYRDLVQRLDIDAARARVAHSQVLRRMGHFTQAVDSLRLALAEFERRGAPDDAVSVAALLAHVLVRTGEVDEALDVLRRHPITSENTPEAVAGHHLAVSVVLAIKGRYDDGYRAAQRALDAARAVPGLSGQGLLARAYVNQATNLGLSGRIDEARQAADHALEPAETYGDPTLLNTVLSTLRENHRRAGRLRDAVTFGERALRLAERSGDPTATAFEQANLAELRMLLEEFEEAGALAEAAVSGSEWSSAWTLPYALTALGLVRANTGHAADAEPLLERAEHSAIATGDRQARQGTAAALAYTLLVLGRPVDAVRVVGQADLVAPTLLAWADLLSGDPDRAAVRATDGVARAERSGERLAEVDARVVLALAHHDSGRGEDAERELGSAEQLAAELPVPGGPDPDRECVGGAPRRTARLGDGAGHGLEFHRFTSEAAARKILAP